MRRTQICLSPEHIEFNLHLRREFSLHSDKHQRHVRGVKELRNPLTTGLFFLIGLAILTPPAPKAGTDETDGSSPLSSKTSVGVAGPFPLALVAPLVAVEVEAFALGRGVDVIEGAGEEFVM